MCNLQLPVSGSTDGKQLRNFEIPPDLVMQPEDFVGVDKLHPETSPEAFHHEASLQKLPPSQIGASTEP